MGVLYLQRWFRKLTLAIFILKDNLMLDLLCLHNRSKLWNYLIFTWINDQSCSYPLLMNVSIQIVVAILQYTYQVYIFCMNIVMYSFLSSLKVDFLILYSNCKSVTFETILSHILVSYTKYVSIVFHELFFTYFFFRFYWKMAVYKMKKVSILKLLI